MLLQMLWDLPDNRNIISYLVKLFTIKQLFCAENNQSILRRILDHVGSLS
jgi:hypothetical protein